MTYQTEIDFHPLYELALSMMVFTHKKSNYDLDRQWFETMESKVSSSFKEKIQNEEQLEYLGYVMILMWKCPNKNSLSEFLEWFHQSSVGEMYEMLYPYFGEEHPKDLVAFREFYTEILTSWNEAYSMDDEIIKMLADRVPILKEEAKTMDPIDFVERCTNGIRVYPMEDLHHVILVPAYHVAPLNQFHDLKHTLFVHIAVDPPSESATIPSISFMRKTKALADAKRLRILQYLSTSEPKTFTEIGKEMKLSKSNLHYHLTLLRTAGLVRITNYKFKEPDKYETRPLGFSALKEDIESYVFENRVKF
ncbi:winged helix-turn-helix domain-containing protein [Neobacillus sp. D3-1R]|uniref:winged helix-turn-helix domain-containing protein n=1 Tax=Neobacillus sp. D3-1R TaxID=3445778 RepID=UPI003F9FE35B